MIRNIKVVYIVITIFDRFSRIKNNIFSSLILVPHFINLLLHATPHLITGDWLLLVFVCLEPVLVSLFDDTAFLTDVFIQIPWNHFERIGLKTHARGVLLWRLPYQYLVQHLTPLLLELWSCWQMHGTQQDLLLFANHLENPVPRIYFIHHYNIFTHIEILYNKCLKFMFFVKYWILWTNIIVLKFQSSNNLFLKFFVYFNKTNHVNLFVFKVKLNRIKLGFGSVW